MSAQNEEAKIEEIIIPDDQFDFTKYTDVIADSDLKTFIVKHESNEDEDIIVTRDLIDEESESFDWTC